MAIRKIKVKFKPTIQLDAMEITDQEYGTNEYGTQDARYQLSKTLGYFSPYIIINGMRFQDSMIASMELDISGFLPRIVVVVKEFGGLFASKHFPKDGDLMSVLIRSNNDGYKTIVRNDYKILSIPPRPSKDSQAEINKFTITGILNVPNIHVDKFASYDGTSYGIHQQIAKDLKLGFASNEDATNDSMIWICPAITPYQFVTQDLTPHTYKDENSFYTSYVDQYYNLNLVEVNSLFTFDEELEQIKATFNSSTNFLGVSGGVAMKDTLFFLSNDDTTKDTPQGIARYSPINNSGDISIKNAYKRVLQMYLKDDKEKLEYFLETLNTEGAGADKIILKGRKDEDISEQKKYKFLGTVATDNMHSQYLHAKIQNYQNMKEIKKLGLIIELSELNPAIYMYQVIPVYIINKGNQVRKDLTEDKSEGENKDGTMDKFLSGFYIVTSIKFRWSAAKNAFVQQLIVFKREFELPLDKTN